MATLVETVNALSPVFFGVLYDELGSTVITDLSGNENHGTYSGSAIFGQPSPIETDPDTSSIGNHVGSIPAPLGSQMDLTGNQTWVVFTYYDDALAATMHAISRVGQFGLSNGVLNGINGGVISSYITLDTGGSGTFYPLTDPVAPVVGNWYMLSTVRNSTVHLLYTNERLANSRSDLTTTPTVGAGLQWNIGSGPFPGLRTCMVIFFDYALNQSQIASIYEAAINTLSLYGVSNVIPSAVLYSDIEPDPVSFGIRHNWSDSLIERITFRTSHAQAVKGYESATQQRLKPRREIELAQVLRDSTEVESFRSKLTANQNRKWFIPILEDREQLTTTLAATSTLMPATVQYRDYEVGSYVELRQLNALGQITKLEQALITSLSPLTTTPIVNTYDPFVSAISPARRGIIEPSQEISGHTADVEELTLIARLVAEDEKTVPNRITPWTPTITYKSYEVHDPAVWQSNDWTEQRQYETRRDRQEIDFNVGSFRVDSDTVAAQEIFSHRMLLEGRDKHAALLGWFYARAGAWSYLWVPTLAANFQFVGASGGDLTVSGHNYFENFAGSEFRRDLAFVYNDNTMIVRRINSVALSGVNEVLTLDSSVPTTVNLRSISYLRFCRLDGDALEIARVTDTKAYFAWRFREMLASPD